LSNPTADFAKLFYAKAEFSEFYMSEDKAMEYVIAPTNCGP